MSQSRATIVAQLTKAGFSNYSIADTLSISESTVRRIKKRAGLSGYPGAARLPDAKKWGGGPPKQITQNDLVKKGDYERVLFVPDIHVPYQDTEALAAMLEFIKDFDPHRVVFLGDVVDFAAISKYQRNTLQVPTVQQCLDGFSDVLESVVQACTKQPVINLIEGNHEQRYRIYLFNTARDLGDLRVLTDYGRLFSLDRYAHATYHPTCGFMLKPYFHVLHGARIRKGGGMTARAYLNSTNTSGVIGHSHRLGIVYIKRSKIQDSWTEAGCLCRGNPGYVEDFVDWQQGFAIGYFKWGSIKSFATYPIPIDRGVIMYGGKQYKA